MTESDDAPNRHYARLRRLPGWTVYGVLLVLTTAWAMLGEELGLARAAGAGTGQAPLVHRHGAAQQPGLGGLARAGDGAGRLAQPRRAAVIRPGLLCRGGHRLWVLASPFGPRAIVRNPT